MMRPVTVHAARRLPDAPVITYTRNGGVHLAWTDGTPTNVLDLTTWGSAANEVGYRIERAPVAANGKVGAYTQVGTTLANAASFDDTTAGSTALYSYRVVAWNAAGNSVSTPVLVGPSGVAAPTAPTTLTATLQTGPQVSLTWRDNATTETGFVVERAVVAGGVTGQFSPVATPPARNNTGNVTFADTSVRPATTYAYRVKAVNGGGSSTYAGPTAVSLPALLAAPGGLTGTATRQGGGERVALGWTGVQGVSGYTIQWSATSTFDTVAGSAPAGSAATSLTTGTIARQGWYFRIGSNNISGTNWSAPAFVTAAV